MFFGQPDSYLARCLFSTMQYLCSEVEIELIIANFERERESEIHIFRENCHTIPIFSKASQKKYAIILSRVSREWNWYPNTQ